MMQATPVETEELHSFVRGDMDATQFPHREHVRMGFEMLRRYEFVETALHYSRALRIMAARAGRPEAFHQTTTIAFLSLIAERMELGEYPNFDTFAAANPDLFDKSLLSRRYGAARLGSAAARRTFPLPDGVV